MKLWTNSIAPRPSQETATERSIYLVSTKDSSPRLLLSLPNLEAAAPGGEAKIRKAAGPSLETKAGTMVHRRTVRPTRHCPRSNPPAKPFEYSRNAAILAALRRAEACCRLFERSSAQGCGLRVKLGTRKRNGNRFAFHAPKLPPRSIDS
jgi:hypothetical protein